MGIPNLLVYLRPLTQHVSVAKYRGKTVAVDAMCWMHRGAVAAATELLLTDTPGPQFVGFVMKMVKMLLRFGVRPVLVFDGQKIPVKAAEEQTRKTRRLLAAKEARELLAKGASPNEKAVRGKIVEAIRVTDDMTERVMQALRKYNVEFIVSPYEADAQLAYLCRAGFVDAVITEDSDLLVYRCPRVLFKVNALGEGQEIRLENVPFLTVSNSLSSPQLSEKNGVVSDTMQESNQEKDSQNTATTSASDSDSLLCKDTQIVCDSCPSNPSCSSKKRSELSEKETLLTDLQKLTFSMFVAMCVLNGSDYTTDVHISGLGLKWAHALIVRFKTLSGVFAFLERDTKWSKKVAEASARISENEMPGVVGHQRVQIKHLIAEFVFKHHYVYNPLIKRVMSIYAAESAGVAYSCLPSLCPPVITFLDWSTSSAALLGSMDNEGQPLWSHTVATDVPDVVACWKKNKNRRESAESSSYQATSASEVSEKRVLSFPVSPASAPRTASYVSGVKSVKPSRPDCSSNRPQVSKAVGSVFDLSSFVLHSEDGYEDVGNTPVSNVTQQRIPDIFDLLTNDSQKIKRVRHSSTALSEALKPPQRLKSSSQQVTFPDYQVSSTSSSVSRRIDLMALASSHSHS